MATINTRGELFGLVYDGIRVARGLPYGKGQPSIMREAVRRVVTTDAQKRGHVVLAQGLALECSRCGMSCAINVEAPANRDADADDKWTVLGALSNERCTGAT